MQFVFYFSLSLSHSLTHTQTPTHPPTHPPTHTHTQTQTQTPTHPPTHKHPHKLLSHTYTHTHKHTHTQTHTSQQVTKDGPAAKRARHDTETRNLTGAHTQDGRHSSKNKSAISSRTADFVLLSPGRPTPTPPVGLNSRPHAPASAHQSATIEVCVCVCLGVCPPDISLLSHGGGYEDLLKTRLLSLPLSRVISRWR